jgi:tetratricopeptide (TPR) repeat protein
VRIGIRVGVNTGEVVAGDGTGGQMLVTGDAVNVAKRLEESARTGEILLGEPTRRLVQNAVVLEPREELTLKGKSDPHTAWNVLAVIEGASAYARRLDAPLIGRAAELELLRAAYADAVRTRSCRLFTIVGPAGIGKSRLASELCSTVRDDATVLTGRCLPYGDGITFWPLVEIIGYLGSDEGVLGALAGAEDAELVAARVLGAVGPTASAAPGGEMFWAVRRLFEEIAREGPVVVVVEDIHWAEPTLLDLLEYLAGWIHDAQVLLLCIARPDLLDQRPGWLTQPGSGVLLEPLTEDESHALLDEIALEWPLDEAARQRIAEAAEGNPLYLEQMAAMLAEGGPADAIPPSIHALIAARLDRLPPEERAVLEWASVAGKHFVRSALRKLAPEADQAAVDARLLSLARKDLLAARPGREDAYRFRHALIRDAAYAGTSKELRAKLHERFAEWAAGTNAGRAGELDEIVGYHLEQAFRYREQLGPLDEHAHELASRAGELLGAAGRRAFKRDDMQAAVKLLDRAIALLTGEHPARLELVRELGGAFWAIGEMARSELLLNGLLEAATLIGDRRIEHHAILELAQHRTMAEPDMTMAEFEEVTRTAIEVFRDVGGDEDLASAWRQLSLVPRARGDFRACEEALEQALWHARRAGIAKEEARVLTALCDVLVYGPEPVDTALRRCAVLRERASGNRVTEAGVIAPMSALLAMRGEFDEARALCGEVEGICNELGLRLVLIGLTEILGAVERLAGDPVAAEAALRRGYEIAVAAGTGSFTAFQGGLLAEALLDQNRVDEAEELVLQSETAAASDFGAQMHWRRTRAQLESLRGRHEQAIALARQAVAIVADTDALNMHGDAAIRLSEVLGRAGQPDQAERAAREALRLYERKGNVVSARRAATFLAEPVA